MTHIIIPEKIDESLNLEVGEDVFIIKETETPTKIVFCRGSKKNREVQCISKVENWKHVRQSWLSKTYAVVKIPKKLNPYQKKCVKTMLIEDEEETFLIILK